jgi:hypothetical protein
LLDSCSGDKCDGKSVVCDGTDLHCKLSSDTPISFNEMPLNQLPPPCTQHPSWC